LFDCIAGVRPPATGHVVLDGRDITALSSVKRARLGVRRTFQRQQVFGWLSVEDNVMLALEWRGGGGGPDGRSDAPSWANEARPRLARPSGRRSRASVAWQRFDTKLPADCRSVSSGVSSWLGRSWTRPRLLLLDEPTSGLEDSETEQLGVIIADLQAPGTVGVLLVEHHIPFVMERCDWITVLDLGKVIASGTPDEVWSNEVVQAAYLA